MLKHKSKARPVAHRKTPTHPPFHLRLFSSLAFWITLWSLMFIYFFIIDLLALIFGEHLIPRLLLDTASLVKVCTIFTCSSMLPFLRQKITSFVSLFYLLFLQISSYYITIFHPSASSFSALLNIFTSHAMQASIQNYLFFGRSLIFLSSPLLGPPSPSHSMVSPLFTQTPYFSTLFSPAVGLKGNHQNIVVQLSVISLASLFLFVVI